MRSVTLDTDSTAFSNASLSQLVGTCIAVRYKNPDRGLRAQLPLPAVLNVDTSEDEEAMQAAVQLWRGLAGRLAGPSSVVVVDSEGKDLLNV